MSKWKEEFFSIKKVFFIIELMNVSSNDCVSFKYFVVVVVGVWIHQMVFSKVIEFFIFISVNFVCLFVQYISSCCCCCWIELNDDVLYQHSIFVNPFSLFCFVFCFAFKYCPDVWLIGMKRFELWPFIYCCCLNERMMMM